MGRFAERLHITPRDYDLLTMGEVEHFVAYLDAAQRQEQAEVEKLRSVR